MPLQDWMQLVSVDDHLIEPPHVWRDRLPVFNEEQSIVKSHLKLAGAVRREHKVLKVRKPIYREVFNYRWVSDHLPVNWSRRLQ